MVESPLSSSTASAIQAPMSSTVKLPLQDEDSGVESGKVAQAF